MVCLASVRVRGPRSLCVRFHEISVKPDRDDEPQEVDRVVEEKGKQSVRKLLPGHVFGMGQVLDEIDEQHCICDVEKGLESP